MNLLTADLTSVDTSRSLIEPGPCRFEVTDVKLEKAKSGLDMVVITYATAFPTKSTKGDVINPGFRITDRLVVTPTEKNPEGKVLANLARLRFSLTGSQAGAFMPLEQYLKKKIDAIVTVESDESGQYGDQNRLKKITAVA